MKSLFDAVVHNDMKQRIRCLRSDSERQWGKLPIVVTLAHCTAGLEMAMGSIYPKRAPFPGNVIGLLIKPMVFGNDQPMRRNSPSIPELFPQASAALTFEHERDRLVGTLERFGSVGDACSRHPHPYFGSLKPEQWGILMYKHLDHHLSQFGV